MDKIWLSVIIPVYNVEKYVRECLESVLSQNIQDIEVICVNDGSTDGSGDILKEYAKKDDRIIVIEQENSGQSVARNVGIEQARGEYITFIDSDDMFNDGALSMIKKSLENNDLEVLCYDASCFYESEKLKKNEYKDEYYKRNNSHGGTKTGKEMFCEFMEHNDWYVEVWHYTINRKWLLSKNITFMPGLIYEDSIYTFQCMMNAKKMKCIEANIVNYRIRSGSIMNSKMSYIKFKSYIICLETVINFVLKETLTEREKNAIYKYAESIVYNIKLAEIDLDYSEKEKVNEFEGMKQFLVECLGIGQRNISNNIYLLGFDEKLKNVKKIVVYGAGKIGNKVYTYIRGLKIEDKKINYAVSNKMDSARELNGIKIKCIDDITEKKDVLVLISARRDYQLEMYENAKNNGFEDIVIIDYRLEYLISDFIREV